MARDRSDVTESHVSEMLCEPVSQVMSRLANVQGRAKRTRDAIDDVGRGTSKRVCDRKRTVMGFCEDSDASDLGACSAVG